MTVIQCGACARHHFDATCPFCHQPAPRRRGLAVGTVLLTALTPMVLAACYGVGGVGYDSWDTGASNDLDGDSFTERDGDCDDTDASIHPGATEVCDDDVDNDCNGAIDDADPACATGDTAAR
jgi:predicted small secreted protein